MSDKNNAFIEYSVKKAEKISSAVYALSNFIPTSDPIRLSLRKSALKLLSDIFSISNMSYINNETQIIVFSITTQTIPEILSLTKIAKSSGFISEMNFSILERELNYFNSTLEEHFDINTALLLSKKDFHVPAIEGKKEDLVLEKEYLNTKSIIKKKTYQSNDVKVGSRVETKKSKRRETILELLKDKSDIGVKEVALRLPQFSQKTIQRELLEMVVEGVLKREGDRRWSRYSLSN